MTFTVGRIIVRGKMVARGDQQRADYVLYQRAHLPIASVEAKDNARPLSDLGTPIEIVRAFGGRDEYLAAIRALQSAARLARGSVGAGASPPAAPDPPRSLRRTRRHPLRL